MVTPVLSLSDVYITTDFAPSNVIGLHIKAHGGFIGCCSLAQDVILLS
jgi:hypothetical protein